MKHLKTKKMKYKILKKPRNADACSESRVYAAFAPRFAGAGTLKRGLRTLARRILMHLFVFGLIFGNGNLVVLACGPWVISPVFKYSYAPENPYINFAAGKLGIVKPTHRKVVLFAAYRYLTGGGFTNEERKDLVDVWEAEFNNKSFGDDDVSTAVKDWVKRRTAVLPKEENLPEIYTERSYGGYEFFPNCTKNAFETAAKTLDDRVASYGSDDKDVKEWLRGQDLVFTNCAAGRQIPDATNASMPEWLQKDREYQLAAANFYSMHYDEAKNRFAAISSDTNSVWQEISQYLVGRTLIRQASSVKDKARKDLIYAEAEQYLQISASTSGKYSDSAKKLLGLVKFRLRPKVRVNELARELSYQGFDPELRQNLIDYSWLLDKFEKESIEAEEARQKALKEIDDNANLAANQLPDPVPVEEIDDGKISISFSNEDYSQNWTIRVGAEATDTEAIAAAEAVAGTLTEKMKTAVREGRREGYSGRYSPDSSYEGGYWGELERTLSLVPGFLRETELTDWLFTYKIQNSEAYLYALNKYKENRTDLWLMTAISKAEASSGDLKYLLEAASRVNQNSPAFQTIAYHHARILMLLKRDSEAKALIDSILNSSLELTVSARNEFLELRVKLTNTLDDYLKYSLMKPFAFNQEEGSMSVVEMIVSAKANYDPEFYTESRQDFEAEIDKQYGDMLPWDNRLMFDYSTIASINKYFSLPLLIDADKSPELPDYMRPRFTLSIWTRSLLLDDFATAEKYNGAVLEQMPQLAPWITEIKNAKTLTGKKDAVLFLLLKNPILTPFLEDGFGRTDNEINSFDIDDWWCQPYESDGTDEDYAPKKPGFITNSQMLAAKAELAKLTALGDAPVYLGKKVFAVQKRMPLDKRIPESLYIVYEANGWKKYGCGNDEQIRNAARDLLLKRYPKSEWTKRMVDEGSEN